MQLQHGFQNPDSYRHGFVSIGNFDGVHCGHRGMISALVDKARGGGVPSVVFTFDPHPITLLRPGSTPPPLSTVQRKAQLIEELGVDCMIVYPTDQELLDLTPRDFFERIILQEIAASGMVEGPNFFFGRDRAGDIHKLHEFCDEAGLDLKIVQPVGLGGRMVSSTAIRGLIATGHVSKAAELLGHRYRIQGTVSRGAMRGAQLGFPTANLESIPTVIPCDGVYAAIGILGDQRLPAAVNVGPNPTFGEMQRKLEVHLIDFSGDLYGQSLGVEFVERLRATTSFAGIDPLKEQLALDIAQARTLATAAIQETARPSGEV